MTHRRLDMAEYEQEKQNISPGEVCVISWGSQARLMKQYYKHICLYLTPISSALADYDGQFCKDLTPNRLNQADIEHICQDMTHRSQIQTEIQTDTYYELTTLNQSIISPGESMISPGEVP